MSSVRFLLPQTSFILPRLLIQAPKKLGVLYIRRDSKQAGIALPDYFGVDKRPAVVLQINIGKQPFIFIVPFRVKFKRDALAFDEVTGELVSTLA